LPGFKKHLADRTGGGSPFRRSHGIKNPFSTKMCSTTDDGKRHLLSLSHTRTRVCVEDYA
jgi:hypothetical protein